MRFFSQKMLFSAITLLVIAILSFGNIVLAKKIELGDKEIQMIKTGLGLLKTFGNVTINDNILKVIFNKTIEAGQIGSDITYGLLVLSAMNEMELIDMVVSQRYKKEATDYFNQVIDERTNLMSYWREVGYDLPRILPGYITGPMPALTLNSFAITDKIISIFTAINVIKQEKIYDGLWRYFDERRNRASHIEAWQLAKDQFGWIPKPGIIEAIEKETPSWARMLPGDVVRINEKINQLESQFAALWDKWGPYTDSKGVTEQAKEQFKQEMGEMVLRLAEEQAFVQEKSGSSFFEKTKSFLSQSISTIKNAIDTSKKFVGDSVRTIKNTAEQAISAINSFISRYNPFKAELTQLLPRSLGPAPSAPGLTTEEETSEEQGLSEPQPQPAIAAEEILSNQAIGGPQPLGLLEEIQEQLDDIAEIVDILSSEVAKLTMAFGASFTESGSETVEPETIEKTEEIAQEPKIEQTKTTKTQTRITSGVLSLPDTTLPKILISEVAAGWDKSENEFVELYNPNNFFVTLTKYNFKLKLVDSSNEITSKRINGLPKEIAAKSFFLLVAGELKTEQGLITADASFSSQLTSVSGVIITDGEDNIKDRVSWGKPDKQPPEAATEGAGKILEKGLLTGQSLGRKWFPENQEYQDTNNNESDFELQTATPKAQNAPLAKPETSPILEVLPKSLEFGLAPTIKLFFISNLGNGILSWLSSIEYVTPQNIDWLNVSPQSGNISAGLTSEISVSIIENVSGPSEGVFLAKILIDAGQIKGSPTQVDVSWSAQELAEETPPEEEQPPEETPPDDDTPPTVFFNDLISPQIQLSFTISWWGEDLAENSSPSGIDGFILRYSEDRESWNYWPSENEYTEENQYDFRGEDEHIYHFQIKAKDAVGNESDWTEISIEIELPKKILINEVQIDSKAGTGGADDDWVELYNPNDYDISLEGFSIQEHSASDPCSTDKGFYKKNFLEEAEIPVKGFFLIVDTEAAENLKNMADLTIGWSLTNNNTVYLVKNQDKIESGDDSDIIDKVGFGNACFPEGNSAPNPPEGKSIERKELGGDTNDNASDFIINDTPRPKNSKGETPREEIISTIAAGFTEGFFNNNGRKIARTSNGDLYVVYFKEFKIYLTKSTDGGRSWDEIPVTADKTLEQKEPSLAVDSKDNLHLVWQGKIEGSDKWQIRYRKYDGNSWSDIENLTDSEFEQTIPMIAIDSQDNVHVAWIDNRSLDSSHEGRYPSPQILHKVLSAGIWGLSEATSSGKEFMIQSLSLSIDSLDNLHFVWQANLRTCVCAYSPSWYTAILYQKYQKAAADWDEIKELAPSALQGYSPSIAIDSDDNIHIVWHSAGSSSDRDWPYIYYIKYIKYTKSTDSWSEVITLEVNNRFPIGSPSVAIDSEGHLYVVWQGASGSGLDEIHQIVYTDSWKSIEVLLSTDKRNYLKNINLLWNFYPVISGLRSNQPETGYAFIYYQGEELKFYGSQDLTWEE